MSAEPANHDFASPDADEFRDYVEHPRFGRGPRNTGLNPQAEGRTRRVSWRVRPHEVIPGTAIRADLSKQTPAIYSVAYYVDARRVCRDCGRKFIFFAEEQKHWYEELGFGLDSDCVRCYPCRRKHRGIELRRAKYEELIRSGTLSAEQCRDLAALSLALIDDGVFTRHPKTFSRIRMWLNRLKGTEFEGERILLVARLTELERDPPLG